MIKGKVRSLNVGKAKTISRDGEKEILSAIVKRPVSEALFLSKVKLLGDEQADLINHGGEDKAVCVYSYEHYNYWHKKLNKSMEPGAFGENITVMDLLETNVCIGDTFKWGEAVVQVCQPRHPCYKLAKRHQVKELPLYVQETGYSGFYLRVLKEGTVTVDDPLLLTDRQTETTIAQVNRLNFQDQDNVEGLQALVELPQLADSWRSIVEKRLQMLI
ncbi:MOSC domain-containing protein [Alteribacter populi]|uniref:MOSC domain-containing protein n=1 Tax=Alteribacter populi TaxID=2011011 RepID=UPI000BBA551B|nr:MOSC domain-containing protein [Alteribacter populi]